MVLARPLLGAWLPAAWVVSALRSRAFKRMIFLSNWFGDSEERGVQQHVVAVVLCVGEQSDVTGVGRAVLEARHQVPGTS